MIRRCLLVFLFSLSVYAQDDHFVNASKLFNEGKYQSTIEELNPIEIELQKTVEGKKKLGLVYYWKALSFNRLQDFPNAITYFDLAIEHGYQKPQDFNYEYGQALFASEKFSEARVQFKKSVNRKFKVAVSLYYLGYVSSELGDNKKAYTFYRAVGLLNTPEAKEVIQAAEVQIGDIYLAESEKRKDSFKSVEKVVIPQYQRALELDRESPLANRIQEKIVTLQRKYDLMLFNLRNGRPAINPPYFIRLAQEFGFDSNVTFAPAETTVSKARQGSTFSKTDVFGRYTFYHDDYFSMAPEFRFNNTYYFNRVEEIYRNDNYLLAPAIRTSYEHTLWSRPASTIVDYDFNEARRDVNAEHQLVFSSRSHAFMIGQRFNYWVFGESTMRLRYRIFDSYIDDADASTTSLVFEQIKNLQVNTLLFYFSYDRTRVTSKVFDTDSFTFRTDFIMSRMFDLFTPSFGLGVTSTDPINDRAERGRELMLSPGFRLSKTFAKRWRANLKYDYMRNDSKDTSSFAFKKQISSLELEYLF